MTRDSLLEVENLVSGYGRVSIVNGVTFGARRGEILAVVGRNGVGKTTLMKCIIGEAAAFGGTIRLNGEEIQDLPEARRARMGIGYVPQGRGLFNGLTVQENLGMGKLVGGQPKKMNFERVFEFFPVLRERLGQIAGTMSGGQQQQLSIGRILIGNPDIILLDEPSEGIQPNIVHAIGDIICRIRDEEGLTVIIVEQNLDLIQSCADRCIVVDKGLVVDEISPDVLSDPEMAKKYLAI